MIKSISNSAGSTLIFIVIFILAVIASIRKQDSKEIFPVSTTQELKGFAILAIVFSHIGYFLVDDRTFLHPLTIIAGVGVDLFLFLSGYGLVMSSIKKSLSILQFYKQRLIRLFVPMWLTISVFYVTASLALKVNYSWSYIVQSYLGIFRTADLYRDINSPLWYFTFILFLYLIFPLVFSVKRPWFSALIIYFIGWWVLKPSPYWLSGNIAMYKVHLMAFPLGMIFASLFTNKFILSIKNQPVINTFKEKINQSKVLSQIVYYLIIGIAIYAFGYFSYYSGVGRGVNIEQGISILTALLLVIIFLMKNVKIGLFYIFGIYSFEIYLIHWPILYSYDIFYQYLPAWLATALYLVFFLGLSWGLQRLTKLIVSKIL